MDHAAPSPPAHKIRAQSAATPAAAQLRIPPEIFLATSKMPASMPRGPPPRATAAPPPLQASAKAAMAPPSSSLPFRFAGRQRGETIPVHHRSPRGAFYVFEKGLRRFFLLRTLYHHGSLLNRRVQRRGNQPHLSRIFHRRGNRQRQRDDSCLRIPRLHELRRLRNVLAVHQLWFHLFVNPGFLHRPHRRPSKRRMRRIRNRDFLNRGIQQSVHTLCIQIDLYALRHPNHDTPHRIVVQRSRLRQSARFHFPRVLHIRRKKQVERRPILDLREKIPTRPVCHIHFVSRLLLKVRRQLSHRELQVRRRGNRDFLAVRSLAAKQNRKAQQYKLQHGSHT